MGGEKKYDLAIIHHEFGHTRFFRKLNDMKIKDFKLKDERQAVINLENPIRLKKGMEPRYTYYNGKRTINIISGIPSETDHTVMEDDPTRLVKIGSKGALRK